MSLAIFQSGTAATSEQRGEIAAEVREWLLDEKEEAKIAATAATEAKRYAASSRAMAEALAEQAELIAKNDTKMQAQRVALERLQQEQLLAEQRLVSAINDKDTDTQERLKNQRAELEKQLASKRFEGNVTLRGNRSTRTVRTDEGREQTCCCR